MVRPAPHARLSARNSSRNMCHKIENYAEQMSVNASPLILLRMEILIKLGIV